MNYRTTYYAVLLLLGLAIWTRPVNAATIAEQQSGYILLQVEKNGEAWYVNPTNHERYYLGRPADAFSIMRELGLGISNSNIAKIPVAGSKATGDAVLRQRLSGRIVLQTEKNGEAWYIYPKTLERYYLGRPADAFDIMRSLGVGITDTDLATIPIHGTLTNSQVFVGTSRGTFTIDKISFDRTTPGLKIMTDTGQTANCKTGCTVLSLGGYILRRSAVAGIHGSYFCPLDYASCSGQTNSYLYPVYNSFSKVMINSDRIKYTVEPLVAIDTTNQFFFYEQAKMFTSYQDFLQDFAVDSQARGGSGVLQAAISNYPPLVISGKNVVSQYTLDTKQATVKSFRGVVAWKGDQIYLLVVRAATVTDAAAAVSALGVDYALNLDGGGSTALYNNGAYIDGPGRNIPNAIVITQ